MTGSLAALKAFARKTPADRCGLCSSSLGDAHAHLLDVRRGALECACAACALLFDRREDGHWRQVPPVAQPLPHVAIDDGTWESLGIPIGLAWFTHSSAAGRVVAQYPSPAGAVECKLPLENWEPPAPLAPDVEALLVNRMLGARECFRVSIDECFALTGLVRSTWRGFTGGEQMRQALAAFFTRLRGGAVRA